MNPLGMIGMNWDTSSLGGKSGMTVRTMTLAGLQGISSAAGLLSQIGATKAAGRSERMRADMEAAAYDMQAQDEMLNSAQSFVAGEGEVGGLRQQLAQTLGARQALAGASGVDVGSGVVADTRRALADRANTSETVTRANAEIVSRRHQINALAAQMRASQSRMAGANAENQANEQASAQRTTGILSGLLSVGKLLMPGAP